MIPDFALFLSFEGISLLHRTPQGWASLGEVPLDSRDLAGDLVRLQKAGLSSGTAWRGTKILLPPEQVRAISLDGVRSEDEARAALEGLTPYAVQDLVIDIVQDGGRTRVAAVARETLAEAEAFADEHGFAPVCFAATLGGAGFPGEAFFGPTAAAQGILGAQSVERDPSTLAPGAFPLARETASEPAPPVAPVEEPSPEPEPEPAPNDATPEPDSVPEPIAQPAAETEMAGLEEAGAAEGDEAGQPAGAVPAVGASTTQAPADEPALEEDAPAQPEAPAPLSASLVPEPVSAAQARPLTGQTRGLGPTPSAKAPPRLSGPAESPVAQGPRDGHASAAWALGAPPTGRPDPRLARRMPVSPVPTPAASTLAAPVDVQPEAVPETVQAVPAPKAPEPKTPRRSPFAPHPSEVRSQGIGGKPRFLGLILTVILLVIMTAVALFAAGPERIAGIFRQSDPASTEVAGDPAPPAAATDATVAMAPLREWPEALSSVAPAPLPQPESPAPEAPRSEDPALEAVASALPEPTAPDGPAETPELPPTTSEAASAAVAAAIAALPTKGKPAAAEDGLAEAASSSVDPAEADRFYAATGVWLRAPRSPVLPQVGSAAAPDPPDAAPAKTLPDLPSLAAALPDALPQDSAAALRGEEDAPPSDASGAGVVAGSPARVPPTRPASEGAGGAALANTMPAPPAVSIPDRPEPRAGALAALGTPEAESSATAWINAMAEPPAVRVPPHPETPPEMLAALEPDVPAPGTLAFAALATPDSAPATIGGVSLAGLRPTPRPEGLAPEQAEPSPEVLASFDGPRPGPRPQGLAPEEPPSADVSNALAEALAQPEPPSAAEPEAAAPQAPDLQSTLAAIVQGAPDPLAGATRQAVAVARVPDVRPRNFGRVVESQRARAASANQQPTGRASAGGNGARGLAAHEEAEAAGEAEIASSAAAVPSGPTATSVAQAATFSDVMALREINLIGVYGQPGARRALVRMGNGRYLRVGVGDELDGGQVTAIGDNALNYVRRGRTLALVIPGR